MRDLRALAAWRHGSAQTLRGSALLVEPFEGTAGARTSNMLMPTVDRYMTREPYRVCPGDSLRHARNLMLEHLIRHLPVLDGERLVGVVSQHDLDIVAVVSETNLEGIEVARVMTPPIEVWGQTPLDEVSALMKTNRRDCVVIKGGHGIEGIFTATDALDALADLVRRATA